MVAVCKPLLLSEDARTVCVYAHTHVLAHGGVQAAHWKLIWCRFHFGRLDHVLCASQVRNKVALRVMSNRGLVNWS